MYCICHCRMSIRPYKANHRTGTVNADHHKTKINVTSNICKKQIHDVGTNVYLHTYNNEKRDRFIKKKNPGFRTRNLPCGR